jgi:hypothetical protein
VIVSIQKSFRVYQACRTFKDLLRALKFQKRQNDAATMIQKVWKGHLAQSEYQKMLKQKRELEEQEKKRKQEELERQLRELENMDNHALDKWLKEAEIDQFDQLMKKYLANEKLTHYPNNARTRKKRDKTTAQEMLEQGMSLVELRNENQLQDSDFGSDPEEEERIGRSHAQYLGDGVNPPHPPLHSLQKTLELAKERHKIMTNISKQYHNLPYFQDQAPNGHLSLKTVLMTKAGDLHQEVPNVEDTSNRVVVLPKAHLVTAQDLRPDKFGMPTYTQFEQLQKAHHRIQYGTVRPTYVDEDERPATQYMKRAKEITEEEIVTGIDYLPKNQLEQHLQNIQREVAQAVSRSRQTSHNPNESPRITFKGPPRSDREGEERTVRRSRNPTRDSEYEMSSKDYYDQLMGVDQKQRRENNENHLNPLGKSINESVEDKIATDWDQSDRIRPNASSPLPLSEHQAGSTKIRRRYLSRSVEHPNNSEIEDVEGQGYQYEKLEAKLTQIDKNPSGTFDSKRPSDLSEAVYPRGDHSILQPWSEGTESMDSISRMEAYEDFYRDYVPPAMKLTNVVYDSTKPPLDGYDDEIVGWNQYSKKTIELMRMKQGKLKKLNQRATDREKRKDPMHRLATFKDRTKVDPVSRRESIDSFQEILNAKQRKAQVPVIFEWDIHPGEVSQKFVVI